LKLTLADTFTQQKVYSNAPFKIIQLRWILADTCKLNINQTFNSVNTSLNNKSKNIRVYRPMASIYEPL